MAAKRCSTCARNYPMKVNICPTCGDGLWRIEEESPDDDTRTAGSRPGDAVSGFMFGVPTIEPPPILVQARLVDFNGQLWIADGSLDDAGYAAARTEGTLIRVHGAAGDIFFELAGRARQKGVGDAGGWWLQRMPTPTEMFADLPVTAGTDDDGHPLPPDGGEA